MPCSDNIKNPFGGDEDPIKGMREHMNWQPAWLRAISKAWVDPEYRERLMWNTHTALCEVGYAVPANLKIKVVGTGSDHAFGGGNLAYDGNIGWHRNAFDTEVTFVLPDAPPAELQATALADYLASGRSYPFTCC